MTHRKAHPLRNDNAPHWRRTITGRSSRTVPTRPATGPATRPATVPAGRVAVDWDPITRHYSAVCNRCTDHLTTTSLDQVEQWASSHDCDPELAALLAEITHGVAA